MLAIRICSSPISLQRYHTSLHWKRRWLGSHPHSFFGKLCIRFLFTEKRPRWSGCQAHPASISSLIGSARIRVASGAQKMDKVSSFSSHPCIQRQILSFRSTSTARRFFHPLEDLERKKMEGKKTEDPEEKKLRLIPQIVHSMSTYCWLLGALATFYLFVFTVSNFAPLADQFMPPAATAAAASPTTHLVLPEAHTALPPAGCTQMLAQQIALIAPSQVCALLSAPANGCTPTHAQHIAMIAPRLVCALLSAPVSVCPASCASSPPISVSHSSSQDKVKGAISWWDRLTMAFLLAAMFCIAIVKPRVDAAAKGEDRAATREDKAYDTAVNEQSNAIADAARAQGDIHRANPCIFPAPGAPDANVTQLMDIRRDAVVAKGKADKKVEDLRTRVGVARMGSFERFMVRSLFALSVLFSLCAGICSACAFYRSAELEMGDSMSLPTVIVIIAIPGVPMVVAHVHFFYVAIREN